MRYYIFFLVKQETTPLKSVILPSQGSSVETFDRPFHIHSF